MLESLGNSASLKDLTEHLKVLKILNDNGVTHVVFGRVTGVTQEYEFESLEYFYEKLSKLDVKGKTVTFAPISTIGYVNTVGLPVYHFRKGDTDIVLSRFSVNDNNVLY